MRIAIFLKKLNSLKFQLNIIICQLQNETISRVFLILQINPCYVEEKSKKKKHYYQHHNLKNVLQLNGKAFEIKFHSMSHYTALHFL